MEADLSIRQLKKTENLFSRQVALLSDESMQTSKRCYDKRHSSGTTAQPYVTAVKFVKFDLKIKVKDTDDLVNKLVLSSSISVPQMELLAICCRGLFVTDGRTYIHKL